MLLIFTLLWPPICWRSYSDASACFFRWADARCDGLHGEGIWRWCRGWEHWLHLQALRVQDNLSLNGQAPHDPETCSALCCALPVLQQGLQAWRGFENSPENLFEEPKVSIHVIRTTRISVWKFLVVEKYVQSLFFRVHARYLCHYASCFYRWAWAQRNGFLDQGRLWFCLQAVFVFQSLSDNCQAPHD